MVHCVHPFNGLFSITTWVSRHQKGKPFWILLEQEMMGWQWHQLDHIQIICTSLQTDNHASTSPLSFYRPDALTAAQPTASEHWRQISSRRSGRRKPRKNQLARFTWKMSLKWSSLSWWSHSRKWEITSDMSSWSMLTMHHFTCGSDK